MLPRQEPIVSEPRQSSQSLEFAYTAAEQKCSACCYCDSVRGKVAVDSSAQTFRQMGARTTW